MTGFNSNLDKLIARFKAIKTQSQQVDFADALVIGVNAAKASMQNRIFNQGQDKDNASLGFYKGKKTKPQPKKKPSEFQVGKNPSTLLTPYERKRVDAGRQIRYKDLEFFGTLRRGIIVIKENSTTVVCSIPNDKLIMIARGQEEQLKTKIFSLSDDERDLMKRNVNAAIKQIYDRLFNP